MFKYAVVILAVIACAAAKPGVLLSQPLAYAAPAAVVAPLAYAAPAAVVAAPAPYVTATSSQVIARNYNGIAAAPVIAPVATPLAAPVIAKYAAAPLAAPLAYSSPLAAPLAYSAPLTAPLAYSAHHVAAPVLL
ncbi:cuticle protein 16.5-like isoform X1 [Drosophila nasuta]|uniref:cuticle protein 16.5-like isoform X1 n=1 Tax=Drosophila nasuta TaxID=42062 RepID=UPI00295EEAA7|nr:cuticle protein 16.5-like isoform X1 [Drosophila nasuta]